MEMNLTTCQVAKIAGCHSNTVLNYEKRGYIHPSRDFNGFRRYSLQDALRLKDILNVRIGRRGDGEKTL